MRWLPAWQLPENQVNLICSETLEVQELLVDKSESFLESVVTMLQTRS